MVLPKVTRSFSLDFNVVKDFSEKTTNMSATLENLMKNYKPESLDDKINLIELAKPQFLQDPQKIIEYYFQNQEEFRDFRTWAFKLNGFCKWIDNQGGIDKITHVPEWQSIWKLVL